MHGARRDPPIVGRPSACAQGRLAVSLRDQIDGSKLAWEAALLRGDAAIADGDAREVEAALAEQRAILVALEARLGEVVASATVEREAEHVVTAVPPPPRRDPLRRRLPAVLGSAAAALVAFTVATLGGVPGVPDVAPVSEATTSSSEVRPHSTTAWRHVDPPMTGTGGAVFEGPASASLPAFEGSVPADAGTASGAAPTDATSSSGQATVPADQPSTGGADERDEATRAAPRPVLVQPGVPAPHSTSPPEADEPATPSLDVGADDLAARLADAPADDSDDGEGGLLP